MNLLSIGLKAAPWLGLLAAGVAIWLLLGRLDDANTRIGALEHSNSQLSNSLKEKENALQSRQRTNNAVKRMPDADKRERLR